MQAKQKVTLYLSPGVHRQLKIRAAIDSDLMSEIAERAIVFYLCHSEVVEEMEASHGQNHRVYDCPECTTSVVLQDGDLVSLSSQAGVRAEEEKLTVKQVQSVKPDAEGKEQLVPC